MTEYKTVSRIAVSFCSAVLLAVFLLSIRASALKAFGEKVTCDFGSETEEEFTSPKSKAVTVGDTQWKITDNVKCRISSDGISVPGGIVSLYKKNPVNLCEGFEIDVVYSTSSEDGTADDKTAFLTTSSKAFGTSLLLNSKDVLIGIAENGDVYHKGNKINHSGGAPESDTVTSKNALIASGEECTVSIVYRDGKLSVTLLYGGGKKQSVLVKNYECEIKGLKQFQLGGDKTAAKRIANAVYSSVSFTEYGEYVPAEGHKPAAVIGENGYCKEYSDADKALTDALSSASSGKKPELKLFSDVKLKKPVSVAAKASLTIDLNGFTIDRNRMGLMSSDGYVFILNEGASLTVTDSSPDTVRFSPSIPGGVITGGAGDDVGGGFQLCKGSTLTMNGVSVVGCVTNDHGGAIRVDGSGVTVNINNAGFYSNMTYDSADNCHGGAIYTDYSDCTVNISNTVFEGNYSEDNGGAIYINDGDFSARGCFFYRNKSLDDGGAVYIESDSKATFDGCVFRGNRADGRGGAAFCNSSEGTRFSATAVNNSCGKSGGAVYVNGDMVCINDSEIRGNSASDHGGAVYVDEVYDINVQGRLVIADNYTNNQRDDLYLDSLGLTEAHVYDGGLYDGSEIYVRTPSDSHTVAKSISEYQKRFFRSDDSSKNLKFSSDGNKTEAQYLITSAVGKGNVPFIIISTLVIAVSLIAAVIVRRRRKERGDSDEDKI